MKTAYLSIQKKINRMNNENYMM